MRPNSVVSGTGARDPDAPVGQHMPPVSVCRDIPPLLPHPCPVAEGKHSTARTWWVSLPIRPLSQGVQGALMWVCLTLALLQRSAAPEHPEYGQPGRQWVLQACPAGQPTTLQTRTSGHPCRSAACRSSCRTWQACHGAPSAECANLNSLQQRASASPPRV